MPTFELEGADGTYEVEAPDAASAVAAFKKMSGGPKQEGGPRKPGTFLEEAARPLTTYPETVAQMNRESRAQMARGVQQLQQPTGGDLLGSAGAAASGVGNVLLGGLNYLTSPLSAGLRTVAGNPIEELTGVPKEVTETALGLALPGGPKVPRRPTPLATEELFDRASSVYKSPNIKNQQIPRTDADVLKARIEADLNQAGYRNVNPDVSPVLRTLDELPTSTPQAPQFQMKGLSSAGYTAPPAQGAVKVADFDQVRSALQQLGKNPSASDAVRRSVKEIDDFLVQRVPELSTARGDYAAASRAEEFGEYMTKAERRSSAPGRSYYTAVHDYATQLRNSDKKMRGWNDAEKAQLDKIITGSIPARTTQYLGSAAGASGGVGGGILATMTGGMSPLAGLGLRKIADTLTEKQIAKLDVLLRARDGFNRQLNGPLEDFWKAYTKAKTAPNAVNLSRISLATRNLSNNLADADVGVTPNDLLKSLFGKSAAGEEPQRAGALDPNGPSEQDIRNYLAATTQNYPNFSDPRFVKVNPEAMQQWLENGPLSQNVEDRR